MRNVNKMLRCCKIVRITRHRRQINSLQNEMLAHEIFQFLDRLKMKREKERERGRETDRDKEKKGKKKETTSKSNQKQSKARCEVT